jgi:hypothetical protein
MDEPPEIDFGQLSGANGAPAMEMKQDPADPSRVFLRINQSLPFGVATRIVMLLDEHRRAEASEEGGEP